MLLVFINFIILLLNCLKMHCDSQSMQPVLCFCFGDEEYDPSRSGFKIEKNKRDKQTVESSLGKKLNQIKYSKDQNDILHPRDKLSLRRHKRKESSNDRTYLKTEIANEKRVYKNYTENNNNNQRQIKNYQPQQKLPIQYQYKQQIIYSPRFPTFQQTQPQKQIIKPYPKIPKPPKQNSYSNIIMQNPQNFRPQTFQPKRNTPISQNYIRMPMIQEQKSDNSSVYTFNQPKNIHQQHRNLIKASFLPTQEHIHSMANSTVEPFHSIRTKVKQIQSIADPNQQLDDDLSIVIGRDWGKSRLEQVQTLKPFEKLKTQTQTMASNVKNSSIEGSSCNNPSNKWNKL